jgi:predicted Zn-dependent protease
LTIRAHIALIALLFCAACPGLHAQLQASSESDLRAKLAAEPGSIEALTQLATLLGREGLHDGAIHYWRRAVELQPAETRVRLSLAVELMAASRNDDAIRELRAVVASDPQSSDGFTNLGAALSRSGRFEDASAAFLSLAKAEVSLLGYTDALPHIEEYQRRQPNDFEGCYVAALIYRRLNRATEAAAELRHAVQINPDDYDAQWNLGAVLLSMGETGSAMEHLRRPNQSNRFRGALSVGKGLPVERKYCGRRAGARDSAPVEVQRFPGLRVGRRREDSARRR